MKKSDWRKARRHHAHCRFDALQREISTLIEQKILTTGQMREVIRQAWKQDGGVRRSGHRSRAGRSD